MTPKLSLVTGKVGRDEPFLRLFQDLSVLICSIAVKHRYGTATKMPLLKSGVWYSSNLCPFRHGLRHAVARNPYISASITSLKLSGNPAAIVRFIIPVHIFSFERIANWARPHILKKFQEGVTPAFTHSDSSTAVAMKGNVIRVKASILRSSPFAVFLFKLWIYITSFSGSLTAKATATLRPSGLNVVTHFYRHGAALAKAHPLDMSIIMRFRKFNYCEAAKYLSGQIFEVVGRFVKVVRSHDVLRDVVVRARWEFAAPCGLA